MPVIAFAPGELVKFFTVRIKGDTTYESDEKFWVKLSNAVNATIVKERAEATIANDDAAPVVSIDDVSVVEGDTGSKEARFTVTLTGNTALPAKVEFATVDGTAKAGTDYIASAGQLVFAPGEHTKVLPILVNGDRTFEPDEQFSVRLLNPI